MTEITANEQEGIFNDASDQRREDRTNARSSIGLPAYSRRIKFGALLIAGMAILACGPVTAATIFDAAADLLTDEVQTRGENGRNGVWIYGGYNPALTIFTPFTPAQHLNNFPTNLLNMPPFGTFQGYASLNGDQTPSLVVNTDTNNGHGLCCNLTPIQPGKILMHPGGPNGGNFGDTYDVPTIRWTAPAAGTINLSARWIQCHVNPQSGRVFANGAALFSGLASAGAGTAFGVTNRFVTAGENIDVGLASGPNGYSAGTTEVDLTIDFTALADEPVVINLQPTNVTVMETAPATFKVGVSNWSSVGYQWQRNSNNIAGATGTAFVIPSTAVTDDGAVFRCVISNSISTNISDNARLTVIPDTTSPTILGIHNVGANTVVVVFSEPIEPVSATNHLNYVLDQGNTVLSAVFGNDDRTIVLATSPLQFGVSYALTVSQVYDRANARNAILPNSRLWFIPLEYHAHDIGNPQPTTTVEQVNNGYTIIAGGADIGGASDQFNFNYQLRMGDFDVRVRIEALTLSDAWAKAGLMARESTNADSRFASVLATPSIGGAYFLSRANTGALATPAGMFPVNYPDTWLRLQRAGNLFSGYASIDGEHWITIGTQSLALPNTLYFGMAVASHVTNQTTTAQFRDLSPAISGTIGSDLPFELLSACSRRTGLIISEIMYHPAARADGRNLEFIELFNPQVFNQDLGGYRFSGDIEFTFPSNTVLSAGAFLVVAKNPADLQDAYGISGVLGPFTNSLPNDRGTVRLRNEQNSILLEVNYDSQSPWPCAADGTGHSLVLLRPSYGEGDPRAWGNSDMLGGSPGKADGWGWEPLRSLVVNELLADSDSQHGFIELFNAAAREADLSGAWLSDDRTTNKYRIPDGTVLGSRGFLAFDESALGFALNVTGGEIFLVNSNQTRVIQAIKYGSQAPGISRGRSPDGSPLWNELGAPSPGTTNSAPLNRGLVINEIMFNPISGLDDDEFIELYNRNANAMDLRGWRLSDGVKFTFPTNSIVPADGFVIVAKNLTNLLAKYPNLSATNTVGNYTGALKNRGERIVLEMPITTIKTNAQNAMITNQTFVTVNEVTYRDGGRWGRWTDGGGSSLELRDPRSDNRLAPNWADSDENAKAPWTTIEHTGALDLGNTNYAANNIQILLLGEGECLVDDIEVISGGNNLVPNGSFETGINGWLFDGNHDATALETSGGFNSARSLHLRASGDGDCNANRIRASLSSSITPGATATLRAKFRWLRGHPEIVLRLRGNWLEASGKLTLPSNLGTPGARNSRAVNNAGPAIFEVIHSPVLPAASQNVIVSARVSDPDGIAKVQLKYRVDPSTTFLSVMMTDDGTGGDGLAGDGIYSAIIPGQPSGTLVAFHVEAADNSSDLITTRFPDDAPSRECLVRFGEPQPFGAFGTYRVWLTQATLNRWVNRGRASNQPLDCTFVNGQQRVIYNAGANYSGSIFKTTYFDSPVGNPCDYSFRFPSDDRLLGAASFKVSYPGNVSDDATAQREQIAFWIARQLGLPYIERRYVNLFVNGARRGSIVEDTQVPNRDVLEELFPEDAEGDLYKAAIWWEADDVTDSLARSRTDATLANFTSGGEKKVARYRWNFQPHSVRDSANDFATLFRLVDLLNNSSDEYQASLETLIDTEEWMRVFAFEHLVGQWDSFGYVTGGNMFPYKGRQGRWTLLLWDLDISFAAYGPGNDLFQTDDPVLRRIHSFPPFRRAYWRALQDAVKGPLTSAKVNAFLDPRYNALRANGIAVTQPDGIKSYISQQRSFVLGQLSTVTANFSVNSPSNPATNRNMIILSGTAPLEVATITLNGAAWPVTWTGVNAWQCRLALDSGTNLISLVGLDKQGQPVPGAMSTLILAYTGIIESPKDKVIISEIMYHPSISGAEFVEIHNTSDFCAFNLSHWRIEGIDCDIADGTIIGPGEYLVFAKDRQIFAGTYGTTIPIAGVFRGQLDNGGEYLKLVRPGNSPDIVDQVKYDDTLPWPVAADGGGASLQLLDPTQDNGRVANWAAVTNSTLSSNSTLTLLAYSNEWRFMQQANLDGLNWTAPNYDDSTWPSGAGLLALEECNCLPEPIRTQLETNLGRITFYFRTHFNYTGSLSGVSLNLSALVDDGAVFYLNGQEIKRLNMDPGAVHYTNYSNPGVVDASAYSGPFIVSASALALGDNAVAVEVHQNSSNSSDIVFGMKLDLQSGGPTAFTPGTANSLQAELTPIPPLWLNEVQPDNLTGLQDSQGHREPWIELYNAGTNLVPLTGLYLANNFTNLEQWTFPTGAVINPGEFKIIFADAATNETTPDEWHTSFMLEAGSGSVVLARRENLMAQVLDYVNYYGIGADRSYGAVPDGQPFKRQQFYYVTPHAANNPALPLIPIFINEWMAANTSASGLADPADGHYDDWFELYNSSTTNVDLSGYYLTDDLASRFKSLIPADYVIPPNGYLLVWADGEANQNQTNQPDLHVNFKLNRDGEIIGLCAPDGVIIDTITYGRQTNNISQGRYRDGDSYFFFMPAPTPRAPNHISPPSPPQLTSLPSAGEVAFSFSVNPGLLFRLEYTDNLNGPTWIPLGSNKYASTNTITIINSPVGYQRFYRVVLVVP